jgi:hypothetical protein
MNPSFKSDGKRPTGLAAVHQIKGDCAPALKQIGAVTQSHGRRIGH